MVHARSKTDRIANFVVTLVAALTAAMLAAHEPAQATPAYRPVGTAQELELAGYAKVLCSAVFVSGRDPAEAARNSGDVLMASGRDKVRWHVDREQKLVRMTLDGVSREARFYGDQGCVIQRPDKPGISFTPVPVKTTLPDAMSQPWPMGDRLQEEPLPAEIDRAKLDAAVEAAFDPPGLTAAFVVVHKGRLIAERYMPGITKDTQLENWSMGKSLTATLLALLVKDGTYTLYLQDGMWQGQRLLPEGWTKFVSTPAPAWNHARYGGLFWINDSGGFNLPKDAYYAAGAGGQFTFIVPSRQLVVVRLGHSSGSREGTRALSTALRLLTSAIRTN